MRRAVLLLSAAACAQAQCAGLDAAACSGAAACVWNAPWKPDACADDPCTAALSTATACVAAEVAVTPCPTPSPEPDFCVLSPCVWKGRCERRPCLHKDQGACDAEAGCKWTPPASGGVPAGPVQAVVDACRQDACGDLDMAKCVEAAGCMYDVVNGCHATGCGGRSNVASCAQDAACRWDETTAQCKGRSCATKDMAQCAGDSECMWTDARCVSKTCSEHNDDRCACGKDAGCTWRHNAGHPHCAGTRYSACPDLDVAVVLDGSGSMSRSFGQHPHGFYAVVEALRAWVRRLPLTGGDHLVGASAAKGTGELRVTFLQFSKAEAQASDLHPTGCVAGACTNGLLSGRLSELEGDLTWHAGHYQRDWTYVHGALAEVADHTFAPAQGAAWRRRVVLVVADGGLTDYDGDACCDDVLGCGHPRCLDRKTFDPAFPAALGKALDKLRGEKVAVYGAGIRRSAGHTARDQAAARKLKTIVSDPADEHFAGVTLDELQDEVLDSLCDPSSTFGKGLVAVTGCRGNADEASCKADEACAWDAAQTPKCR
eukprot:Rhum_TRINITY_DN10111_c0_g1::Rhum_TRINITY_DN10111_c0_g1_i1::g.36867::m.36867